MNRNKLRIFPFQKIKVIQRDTNNRYLISLELLRLQISQSEQQDSKLQPSAPKALIVILRI